MMLEKTPVLKKVIMWFLTILVFWWVYGLSLLGYRAIRDKKNLQSGFKRQPQRS